MSDAAALAQIFSHHLPEKLAQATLPEDLATGQMLFVAKHVGGEPGGPSLAWALHAAASHAQGVRFEPVAPDAPHLCQVRMAASDYCAWARGELNPQLAFMQGRLKVVGDAAQAMRLGALFG